MGLSVSNKSTRPRSPDWIKPKAFIVLRSGVAADARLIETPCVHVKECAGPWKYPRWIDVRPDLPRTATGKIQRYKLRELES